MNNFDIYSTAAQLKALELMPREYTFLYDTFCKDGGVVEDDAAIYDFRKGIRQMAPVVVPGVGGVMMSRTGYETRKIGFATIAPEREVTMNDIKGRAFGEEILGGKTPEQRSMEMQTKDLMEMRAAIQRRRDWMARQVLLTGKLELFRYTHEGRDKKTTLVADYGFTQNYTPTTAWNQAGAKIREDMEAIYDLVYNGLGQVDIIVMDPNAANAMKNNSDYMATFDHRRAEMGELQSRYVGQGVRFIGWNEDGVEMYSFSGKFTDDDGQVKPILPSGTVIAGSRGILNAVHGPVTQVEENGMNATHRTYIAKEVPLRYGSIDSGAIMNRLTSCPTIVPFNVDSWCVASVL